jgi:hypothetical protein
MSAICHPIAPSLLQRHCCNVIAATSLLQLHFISSPYGNPLLLLPAAHHRRSSTCSSPPPPLQHLYPCSSSPLLLHLQLTTAAIPATVPQLQRHQQLHLLCCLTCSPTANHCCCCSIYTPGAHHCCSRTAPPLSCAAFLYRRHRTAASIHQSC